MDTEKKLSLAEKKYQEKKNKLEVKINLIYKEAETLSFKKEQAVSQFELLFNSLINLTKEAFFKDKSIEPDLILKLVQDKKHLAGLIKRLADNSIKKEFNKLNLEIEKHQKQLDKTTTFIKNQEQKLKIKILDLYQKLNKLNFHHYLQKKKEIKPLYFYLKNVQENIQNELNRLEKELQTCDEILNNPKKPKAIFDF